MKESYDLVLFVSSKCNINPFVGMLSLQTFECAIVTLHDDGVDHGFLSFLCQNMHDFFSFF